MPMLRCGNFILKNPNIIKTLIMSTEQVKKMMSVMDIFSLHQETFEEAKKKSNDESNNRATYLRLSQDGTYAVRILPLAPVIDAEGNATLDRKGYEYPVKELVLKIEDNSKKDAKGKAKTTFVNVCNAKYAFPKLTADLIDTYVATACDLYSDDEALCKKLKESSFNGGLKWDSKRSMYVYDMNKRSEGLQILQLSYAQYKELEGSKLQLWTKLSKNGQVPCPISSISDAYGLEIRRTTESKKTKYNFNIDVISGKDQLAEEELQALLDAPRLPEVLYRYTRFHLEATIVFLKQMDERMGISVMKEAAIADCIEQIKLLLPADDTSHFSFGGGTTSNASSNSEENALDALWNEYQALEDQGLDDKTEEGQNLRTSIKEYIEENGLDVRVGRSKSNLDLLNEIEDALADGGSATPAEEEDEEPAPVKAVEPAPEPEEEDEEEDEEPATPAPVRRQRSDDTNEPAARPERRSARPARRR